MSAAEAPKSEQIQANVAKALSRLRGELGASSSPVAGTVQSIVPKAAPEPSEPNFGPLPAGPVRMPEPAPEPTVGRMATVIRPFEPTLGSTMGANAPAPTPDTPEPAKEAAPSLSFLGMRREPTFSAEPSPSVISNPKLEADAQPDLLTGMEVPPAPPPPLAALESEDEVGGRGRRMRNRLLLALVVLLVVGGGGWAYLQSHRTSGPVPVITADATPEKVKPADEGGMQVPNQNVQILDDMNGGDTNSQGTENVLPAPEQPVAPPAAGDTTPPQAPTTDAAPATTANENAPTVTEQPDVPSVPAPAIPNTASQEPAQPAPVQAPPAVAETSKAAQPQPAAPEPTAPAAAAPAEAPKPVEPPKAAEAPKPAQTQTAAAPAAPTPAPTPAAGSARIQLAAVKSEALAKEQWAKFQKAHPDLLGNLTLSIQKIDRNGTTYYRIQAGPLSDKNAAKALCGKLVAQKQDCIVAK